MASGVWGRAPSVVQRQKIRGETKPPEAESLLRIGHPKEGAN